MFYSLVYWNPTKSARARFTPILNYWQTPFVFGKLIAESYYRANANSSHPCPSIESSVDSSVVTREVSRACRDGGSLKSVGALGPSEARGAERSAKRFAKMVKI